MSVEDLVCCPRCREGVVLLEAGPRCSNPDCIYYSEGFPIVGGQPVLIDFDRSLFPRSNYTNGSGSVVARDETGKNIVTRLWGLVFGTNSVAPSKSRAMLELVKRSSLHPVILVIGGGAIGSGAACLYSDPKVDVVGTDVYASANTKIVADGHSLPFKQGMFDAVWIQAVLEHVLEPQIVVDEIHRVLKPGGCVYADTPFMQQVHEGAYDFTRFTQSGHRWLFRQFEQIDAGSVGGAGIALVWSIRYFVRALGVPDKFATLAVLPFYWLRYLDAFAKRRPSADAASSVFFFGRKSERSVTPQQVVAYYESENVEFAVWNPGSSEAGTPAL